MLRKNTPVQVYTWNPDYATFEPKTLDEKVAEFEEFVRVSQAHFVMNEMPSESVCLIVAPDLIFSAPNNDIYSLKDKEIFESKLPSIGKTLDPRCLVIAGAIEYAMEDRQHYVIRSYYFSHDMMGSYDKKEAAQSVRPTHHLNFSLLRGQKTGIFSFNGLRIGIENCQDHEKGTLKHELSTASLDIHILLSAGQLMRPRNLCVRPHQTTIFVQCEREPGRHRLGKEFKDIETGVYTVTKELRKWLNSPVVEQEKVKKEEMLPISEHGEVKLSSVSLLTSKSIANNSSRRVVEKNKRPVNVLKQPFLLEQLQFRLLHVIKDVVGLEIWSEVANLSAKPQGVARINLICIENANQILGTLKQIQAYSSIKAKSWHLLRGGITQSLYKLLSEMDLENVESINTTLEKLIEITKKLQEIKLYNADIQPYSGLGMTVI